MKAQTKLFRIFSISLLPAIWACAADVRSISPKLKRGEHRICSILLLPAQVTVTKFGMKGPEGLWEENDRFEDEFAALVGKMLSGYGSKVVQLPPGAGTDGDALAAIQRGYDRLEALIGKSPGGVRKGRFTLGDSVAAYSPSSSADTLVFVRGKGEVPANKLAGLGSFTWFGRRLNFEGRLAFVDARSGDVLAWVEFTCDHPWNKNTEALRTHIKAVLGGESPTPYGLLVAGTVPPTCQTK